MLKVGIVGTGGMGTVHYHNYRRIEGAQVTALVGITDQSRQCAKDWGLPLYDDIHSMVRETPIDVVDVCSPTYLHKEHVVEGLECGAHVITEKPVALHLKDAEMMYALAEKQGRQLFVGQVLQMTKETEVLRQLIKSLEYGPALDGFFERLSACPRWAQNGWLFDREKSGLLPFDLHIHDLDLIVGLFGVPESYSFTNCGGRGKNYKEQYRFNYHFKTLNVAAEAAWFNADFPFTARWRVYFENAVVVNDGSRVVAYQFDHEPRVFDTRDEISIPTGINLPPTGMFYRELSHFLGCIEQGIPSDKVTKTQVLTVVRLLEEMTRSQ